MHYGIEDATHLYTCIPLQHIPRRGSFFRPLYLVLPIPRDPRSLHFFPYAASASPLCRRGTAAFLIISQIKVRFILSFFTATDSSREAREYAEKRNGRPDRRINEFARELSPSKYNIFTRAIFSLGEEGLCVYGRLAERCIKISRGRYRLEKRNAVVIANTNGRC